METFRLKSLLETLIFVSEAPLKTSQMLEAVQAWEVSLETETEAGAEPEPSEDAEAPSAEEQLRSAAARETSKIARADVQEALAAIERDYRENAERGIILVEVGGGWQFRTRPENAAVIRS